MIGKATSTTARGSVAEKSVFTFAKIVRTNWVLDTDSIQVTVIFKAVISLTKVVVVVFAIFTLANETLLGVFAIGIFGAVIFQTIVRCKI